MIDQAGWGSTKIYDDYTLYGDWDPQYLIIHWGGLTSEVNTLPKEASTLRGWQRYHLTKDGGTWQDIAYNYAIGESGNLYRLRGENHAGHTSGRTPDGLKWNSVGVGVVWIGGKADSDGPSRLALDRMAAYVRKRDLPVLGHVQTGKATACPGPDWLQFVEDYKLGEYDMAEQAPNLSECSPWQVDAWIKADLKDIINKNTYPQDLVNKGDLMVFFDRLGLLD